MDKVKYKVSQLAKDMGLTGKVLVELLKQKGDPEKKYTTTTMLSGEELDMAYEIITKEHSVESFDEFLSQAQRMTVSDVTIDEVEAAKEKKAAEKKLEKPVAEKAAEKVEKAGKPVRQTVTVKTKEDQRVKREKTEGKAVQPEPVKPAVKSVAPEPVKTVQPEAVKPAAKTVAPEPVKAAQPEAAKAVRSEPTEAVKPEQVTEKVKAEKVESTGTMKCLLRAKNRMLSLITPCMHWTLRSLIFLTGRIRQKIWYPRWN